MRGGLTGLIAAAAFVAAAAPASAQRRFVGDVPRAGSWELSGGATWSGGFDGPEQPAELTRNGDREGGFDLFQSDSRVGGAPGAGAALAYYVSRAVAIEGGIRFSRPRLTVDLSGDFENAEPISADEVLTRYVMTGSFVLHLRQSGQAVPFVAVGAGYVRDLHEGQELVETGTEYHVLGGIKYWFGRARRRFGLRGEAGMSITDGGFDFKDEPRVLPIASARLIYLF